MRHFKRFCLLPVAVVIVITAAYFFLLAPRYSVPILMYHYFSAGADQPKDLRVVSEESFQEQMAYLKKHKYNVISFDALAQGLKQGKVFPQGTVVITMDDGDRTDYMYAYPILKKYGFPAIIFLCSDFIDQNDPQFLTWDQVREMTQNGMSFGAHTRRHMYLPNITDKALLWEEITGSKKAIEKEIGQPVDYFSYPIGGFREDIKTMVKKAGYKAAVTTNRGIDLSNIRDSYELHRVSVRNGDVSWRLWGKLSGYYNAFRKAKK